MHRHANVHSRPIDAIVGSAVERFAILALLDDDALDRVGLDPAAAIRVAYAASLLRDPPAPEHAP